MLNSPSVQQLTEGSTIWLRTHAVRGGALAEEKPEEDVDEEGYQEDASKSRLGL